MLSAMLVREKFEVDEAADGEEAIRMIQDRRYQLIVIDLMMPKVDGYTVVQYLKENLPPSLKRIVVTTADTAATGNPFPEEVCSVLAKPFDMDEFISLARSCSEDTLTRARRTVK